MPSGLKSATRATIDERTAQHHTIDRLYSL
jgi:hypothetical protein